MEQKTIRIHYFRSLVCLIFQFLQKQKNRMPTHKRIRARNIKPLTKL